MAKSKNHTNKNQNRKDHRNGIYRPNKSKKMSLKGVDRKYVRNLRYARRKTDDLRKQQKKEAFEKAVVAYKYRKRELYHAKKANLAKLEEKRKQRQAKLTEIRAAKAVKRAEQKAKQKAASKLQKPTAVKKSPAKPTKA